MSYAIGADVGGTNIKFVAVTPDGQERARKSLETVDDATRSWAKTAKRQIEAFEREFGPAQWIGITSPGLAARDGRTIAWMQGKMDGVQGFDWTEYLQRKDRVPVLNDAHAAMLGEMWRGAAVGTRDAVLLTLGTGVGGAIVCDGKLLKGHLGRAGHLGHITLDADGPPDLAKTPGSLEDAIGDHSIALRTGGRFDSTRALVEAYRKNDADARRVWLRSIHVLACGIISIINAVDPEVVVLGGGISNAGDDLFGPLREYMNRFEWRPTNETVRIVPAKLGDMAGALGAAWNAMNFQKAIA